MQSAALQIYDDLAELDLTVDEALRITDSILGRKEAAGPPISLPGMLSGLSSAADTATSVFRNVTGGAKGLIDAGMPAVLVAGALPTFAGYTLGDMLAGAMDVDKSDVSEIQEQELIREMNANAEALRRRTQLRAAAPKI